MILDPLQSIFTPDADTVHEDVFCGVCEAKTEVKRGCNGPRGFAAAMGGGGIKSNYDFFRCPHYDSGWHKQVVALYEAARETPSSKLTEMYSTEAANILSCKRATKRKFS